MKILRIIARLNVGGPARHVVWLTQALQGDGVDSKLIAGTVPEGEEDMSYFAAEHGVEPIYIREMSRELSAKDAVSLWKVLQVIRRDRPDIIHTHTAKAGTVGRAAAFIYKWFTPGTFIGRPRRVRVVHTFHGHVFHSYYGRHKTKIFVLIEKILARFATDKIIVITPQQLREIHSEVGVGREKQFEVVSLGIDLSKFDQGEEARRSFRKEFGISDETVLVGFVGRLTEIKNVPMLLRAAKVYIETGEGPATKFIIIGDGHLRHELERLVEELGMNETVIFAGNREDLGRVYSGLDLIALTSLNEGTPLSVIEAMASRRPVIATLVGGVVDLLGPVEQEIRGFSIRERGVGVPSGDVTTLAKGLIYLAKNGRLRFDLGNKGHQFALDNYGKERLISDIRSLYSRLLEK
ncbi:MAG: glycosyltransferase [bacterium]|nr:glycosyltransferase [bacterium]